MPAIRFFYSEDYRCLIEKRMSSKIPLTIGTCDQAAHPTGYSADQKSNFPAFIASVNTHTLATTGATANFVAGVCKGQQSNLHSTTTKFLPTQAHVRELCQLTCQRAGHVVESCVPDPTPTAVSNGNAPPIMAYGGRVQCSLDKN